MKRNYEFHSPQIQALVDTNGSAPMDLDRNPHHIAMDLSGRLSNDAIAFDSGHRPFLVGDAVALVAEESRGHIADRVHRSDWSVVIAS